jgi:hypothetical protein
LSRALVPRGVWVVVETLRETTVVGYRYFRIVEKWTPCILRSNGGALTCPVPERILEMSVGLSFSAQMVSPSWLDVSVPVLERGVFDAPLTPLHQILDQRYVVSFEQHHIRHTTLQPPSSRCGLACHMAFSGTSMDGRFSAWQ